MSAFTNAVLMITGGTGSFGNTVLKHFLTTDIGQIRIFSRDEKKQDDMRHDLQVRFPDHAKKVKFYLGDVRNAQAIKDAMQGVDYVFHAAALKQVPSCEFFPMEAVRTNVMGTDNMLHAAIEAKCLFKENRKANIYEAIFNVFLSLVLVLYWGAGVLAAGAITGVIRSIGYMVSTEKLLPVNQFWKNGFQCGGYLLLGILFYCLLGSFTVPTWLEWIGQAVMRMLLVIVILTVFIATTNPKELKLVYQKISSLFEKNCYKP